MAVWGSPTSTCLRTRAAEITSPPRSEALPGEAAERQANLHRRGRSQNRQARWRTVTRRTPRRGRDHLPVRAPATPTRFGGHPPCARGCASWSGPSTSAGGVTRTWSGTVREASCAEKMQSQRGTPTKPSHQPRARRCSVQSNIQLLDGCMWRCGGEKGESNALTQRCDRTHSWPTRCGALAASDGTHS